MSEHLARYLNDHLAGSVVAIELLEHLLSTETEADDAAFLAQLRHEIIADRDELRSLMLRLNIGESRPRQFLAGLTEKIGEFKLRLDDRGEGAFRWFEALEILRLGIEGKRLLWSALAAAEPRPEFHEHDFARLRQRAELQAQLVEARWRRAAQAALAES